jgi:hypothetical protein
MAHHVRLAPGLSFDPGPRVADLAFTADTRHCRAFLGDHKMNNTRTTSENPKYTCIALGLLKNPLILSGFWRTDPGV